MDRKTSVKRLVATCLLACFGGGMLLEYYRDESQLLRGSTELGWTESSWASIKPTKALRWVDCYDLHDGFECARLQVPLNYSDSEGKPAAIALIRLKASVSPESPEYLGPILFNPGGPGASGVSMILGSGKNFAKVLGPQFDIVGFDPRGIARSTPRVSWYQSRAERELWKSTPVRELNCSSDLATAWARSQINGQLAAERALDVLPHIQTDHTVRDMLTVTEAYGRENLSFWGFSYGTVLGSTFAALFPDKVHRMVIDGVVDVEKDYDLANWKYDLINTDDTLKWFFQDCYNAGPTKCPFYEPSPSLIAERLRNLYTSVIRVPIPVHTSISYGLVDYARLRLTIFSSLYSPFARWARLAAGLADLEAGNGTALYQMLDQRPFSCSCDPLEHAFDVVAEAGIAITCNDSDFVPPDLEDAEKHYLEAIEISEWGSLWTGMRIDCSSWPKIPKNFFRGPISGNTSHPILLIGNTADPVTPLHAAHEVSKSFPGSVVLSQDSAGHCSLAAPSLCTVRIIREYFISGTLPKPGTWCPIIGTPFENSTAGPTMFESGRQQPLIMTMEDEELLQAWRQIGESSSIGRLPFHI